MEMLFGRLEISISTIKAMNSEFEADALQALKETGSLQNAVATMTELQKQKERFMEQARREAERGLQEKDHSEKGREEKAEGPQAEEKNAAPDPREEPEGPALAPASETPEAAPFSLEKTLTVTVKVGENDLGLLKDFLDMAGLEYEVM